MSELFLHYQKPKPAHQRQCGPSSTTGPCTSKLASCRREIYHHHSDLPKLHHLTSGQTNHYQTPLTRVYHPVTDPNHSILLPRPALCSFGSYHKHIHTHTTPPGKERQNVRPHRPQIRRHRRRTANRHRCDPQLLCRRHLETHDFHYPETDGRVPCLMEGWCYPVLCQRWRLDQGRC